VPKTLFINCRNSEVDNSDTGATYDFTGVRVLDVYNEKEHGRSEAS